MKLLFERFWIFLALPAALLMTMHAQAVKTEFPREGVWHGVFGVNGDEGEVGEICTGDSRPDQAVCRSKVPSTGIGMIDTP